MPLPRTRAAPIALLAILAALAPLAAPGPAAAGAWTRAPGETQLIATAGLRGAPLNPGEGGGGEGGVAQVYAEHGLAEGLTLGGKLFAEVVPGEPEQGSAAAGLFLRRRFWQQEGAVLSGQLDVQAPVERLFGADFARSKPYSAAEAAVRALYGRSWWGERGSAFVSAGAGYAWRAEGNPGDALAEATAGAEPSGAGCCLAMFSAHARLPVHGEGGDAQLKLQPSAVWHLRRAPGGQPTTSVQFGLTYDVLNSGDGAGLFLGLWRTF